MHDHQVFFNFYKKESFCHNLNLAWTWTIIQQTGSEACRMGQYSTGSETESVVKLPPQPTIIRTLGRRMKVGEEEGGGGRRSGGRQGGRNVIFSFFFSFFLSSSSSFLSSFTFSVATFSPFSSHSLTLSSLKLQFHEVQVIFWEEYF